jgi:hypothetical protein
MKPIWMGCLVLLALGCGGEGGSDSSPTEEQIFLVQKSADASGGMTRVFEAANSAVLASGSQSYSPGPHAVPVFPGATPAFDYGADVDVLIDFDAEDADGNDLAPDATGQVRVVALGTVTGDDAAGTATFSVDITAETDLTLTNPDNGTETTIPAGAAWSYLLVVEWTEEDSDNWSVTATATTTVDVQDVIVDDGDATVTVDVLGFREVVSSFSRTNGRLSHERSFEGSITTSVDDGESVESVVLEFVKPGRVRISVLGGMFGPLNEGQVRALFRTVIR